MPWPNCTRVAAGRNERTTKQRELEVADKEEQGTRIIRGERFSCKSVVRLAVSQVSQFTRRASIEGGK